MHLIQMRDMLEEACQHRSLPDCEFFINKRDYPHLKSDLTEPYDFIFDPQDLPQPLPRERYPVYAPIVSFYCSPNFADLPFPESTDWEAATGMVSDMTWTWRGHGVSCVAASRADRVGGGHRHDEA